MAGMKPDQLATPDAGRDKILPSTITKDPLDEMFTNRRIV